jgi:drug/metabolite transporter (DMT)-like permease
MGTVAAIASAASWAAGAILMKKVGENLSSLAMTLAKGGISILMLALVVPFTGWEMIPPKALWFLLFSGVLGIAVSDTCFFAALKGLSPLVMVLLMMLGQVLTVIFAVVFLHESLSPLVWVGVVLILAGVGVVVAPGLSDDQSGVKMRSVWLGVASVVSMSVSIIVAKRALDITPTVQATLLRMFAGTAGMFAFGVATRQMRAWMNPFQDRKLMLWFLMTVAIVTFGGFWLSLVSIKYLDVCVANTLIATEPLFVLLFSAVFVGEKPSRQSVCGSLIAVAGVTLLVWQKIF